MSQEFNIRALDRNDWEQFRAVRLRALQDHRSVYGSSYEAEKDRTDQEWKDFLHLENSKIHGAFHGEQLIGLSAVFGWREDKSGKSALLAMWYMDEKHRRADKFTQLVQASIDWAEAQSGFERIVVSHRDGNDASRRVNRKLGFYYTHTYSTLWPDGVQAQQHYYERQILR